MLDCRQFLQADVLDALTLAAAGSLEEAAEILDLGLLAVESLPDREAAGLVEAYRYAFVALRELHPAFATPEPALQEALLGHPDTRDQVVLVVADDLDTREALAEFLSAAGFTVACASDEREALACIQLFRPTVMLLDLMLPRMRGWELLRLPEVREIARLVFAALSPSELPPPDLQGLGVQVLRKPVTTLELQSWLHPYTQSRA